MEVLPREADRLQGRDDGPCDASTNAHMSVRITNDTRKLMKTSMSSGFFHRGDTRNAMKYATGYPTRIVTIVAATPYQRDRSRNVRYGTCGSTKSDE